VKSCNGAVGGSQAFLATLTTAEAATRARAGVNTSTSMRMRHTAAGNPAVPAFPGAKARVRMTDGNRAAGHTAASVSAPVRDRRSALRKLGASPNSRADTTAGHDRPGTSTAEHGFWATADNCGTDSPLPVKLMGAARTTSATGDNAGRGALMIEKAMT